MFREYFSDLIVQFQIMFSVDMLFHSMFVVFFGVFKNKITKSCIRDCNVQIHILLKET